MKTIRRLSLAVASLLMLALLLSACLNKPLADAFDRADLEQQAQDVLDQLNAQETEALRARCTVMLREALTDQVMGQLYEALDEGGAFETIQSISVAGTTDQASKEDLAVVVVTAQYELKRLTFTLAFTQQMKLAGLYYK